MIVATIFVAEGHLIPRPLLSNHAAILLQAEADDLVKLLDLLVVVRGVLVALQLVRRVLARIAVVVDWDGQTIINLILLTVRILLLQVNLQLTRRVPTSCCCSALLNGVIVDHYIEEVIGLQFDIRVALAVVKLVGDCFFDLLLRRLVTLTTVLLRPASLSLVQLLVPTVEVKMTGVGDLH